MHPLRWDLPKLYLFLSHRNVANQTGTYIYIYYVYIYMYIYIHIYIWTYIHIYIYICTYIYIYVYIYIHICIPIAGSMIINQCCCSMEGSSIRNGGQSRSVIQRVGPKFPMNSPPIGQPLLIITELCCACLGGSMQEQPSWKKNTQGPRQVNEKKNVVSNNPFWLRSL